ncbi:MAG: winged helix-turn-helix domain-containing protein [Planctomycetaceae bacterium]|nr:winged helix-turn-helix domain-containing protein [Planctomycetaceae bacterium]
MSRNKTNSRSIPAKTRTSADEIRHHIEKTCGVKYSPTGVRELLHRPGFVDKKPKHMPGKVDMEKQAAFIAA